MLSKSLITLLSILPLAWASMFDHSKALGQACGIAAKENFPQCGNEDYDCICSNKKYIQTVQNCIRVYTKGNSTEAGAAYDKFAFSVCTAHHVDPEVGDAWKDLQDTTSLSVDDTKFKKAYKAEKNNMKQKETSVWLGIGLIFYWVLITGLVTAYRALRLWCYRFLGHGVSMGRPNKVSLWMKKYILWPAFIGHKHMSRFEYMKGWISLSTPLRAEVIAVSGYIILNIIFMVTPYEFMDQDPLFPTKWKEMMRYSSDRAGIIAVIQFPLLTLFASRNNLLIWITGWSYSTFNTYHRATSRVTYLMLVVHAVLKHIFSASYGGSLVKYYYPAPYFRWGVAALGLLSLMIASAIIRARGYEFFYRLHQACAFCAMICSIYHLNGIGFKTPLYIAYGFWGADIVIRVCKILFTNINSILPPLPGSQRATFATAEVQDNDLVLIKVTTPLRWVCSPGQYIYLHTRKWMLIGGHPFSVVGSKDDGEGLELLIKPRLGFTNRLMKKLRKKGSGPNTPVTLPVFIEGPYGVSAPVHRYDCGLFFAGGIGITGVLGYIDRMIETQHRQIPKRIKLYWSIRKIEDIDPVRTRLDKFLAVEGFELQIYIHHKPPAHLTTPHDLESQSETTLNEVDEKHKDTQSISITDPENIHISSPLENDSDSSPPPSRQVRFTAQSAEWNLNSVESIKQRKPKSRNSLSVVIKARHPDDDDEWDYGRHSYEHYKTATGASQDDKDESKPNTTQPEIIPGNNYPRNELPQFIAAGFRDVLYERKVLPCKSYNKRATMQFPNKMVALHEKPTPEKFVVYEGLNIPAVIENQFWSLGSSICVIGCGPDRLMDTLRWSCCEFLTRSKCDRIDYYEEAFRW